MQILERTIFSLILAFVAGITAFGQGGDQNGIKSQFTIQSTDSNVVIEARFDEPLNEAMLDYFPQYDTATTEYGLNAGIKHYVKSSIQLLDRSKDRALNLLEVRALPRAENGIQYLFIYEQGRVTQMRNMLLFNMNKEQKNHNVYIEGDLKAEFTTTPLSPVWTIDFSEAATSDPTSPNPKQAEKPENNSQWVMWIAAIAMLLAVWMFLKRRNETARRNRRGR